MSHAVLLDLPASIPIDPATRDLDLVPIAAAHVERRGGGLHLVAVNRAFRQAELAGEGSPLLAATGGEIDGFLDSRETERRLTWQHGDAIDCRHYDIHLSRASPGPGNRCQIYLIDETAQHRTEHSLRRGMTTDSLTGLHNREGFSDAIEASLAAGGRVAILVVDLDRFGRLNACLGGLVADELLITVARRIRGTLRARDTLARIGGDEFGIVLSVRANDEAYHAAKRIERVLAKPFRLTDYEIGVEASIGIAFSETGGDVEELVRHAQFAVKQAKEGGQVETYQAHAFVLERERFGIETRLRRAIENRELRLTFQPICDLASGRPVSVEALARWRTPAGEEIEPKRFIPVAEESGLIVPLGRWALEEALATLARWDRDCGGDCGIPVAVNVSPIQLQRDTLIEFVGEALRAARLPGNRLKLELTESALVTDPQRTAAIMTALKSLGATIAMDDFGTGYSNLALLQSLPIDVLKIDRSFVTGMLADRDKLAIVRAVLSLAQSLGMRTIAEGVETTANVEVPAAMGCTMGQGYVYARPLERDEAFRWISARR